MEPVATSAARASGELLCVLIEYMVCCGFLNVVEMDDAFRYEGLQAFGDAEFGAASTWVALNFGWRGVDGVWCKEAKPAVGVALGFGPFGAIEPF